VPESGRDKRRISPVVLPPSYQPPSPPDKASSEVVQDTFRQTKFLLAEDLHLFAAGMQWQVRVQQDSHASKFRSHELAALTLFWTRAYAALRDGLELLMRGAYVSIPHLCRSAAECIGVQSQLRQSEMDVYDSWLDSSLAQDHEQQALDLNLGRYRAASILAADEELGRVYRLVSDLSMTPFGGSLFLAGPESNHQRILLGFGDQAFHAGYAELMVGWLLRLCERQVSCSEEAGDIFNITQSRREEAEGIRSQIGATLARTGRCRAEEVEIHGERRYLIHNFRRSSAAAPRRILL
jgi:hypothetical protein